MRLLFHDIIILKYEIVDKKADSIENRVSECTVTFFSNKWFEIE